MKTEPASGDTVHPVRFKTTRWTVVLSCAKASGAPEIAREALTELCRAYWRPVYALICSHGHSPVDAQDLTQDFFVMLLKGNLLSLADPSRGRFRRLLRRTVENFLSDKHQLSLSQKRGGTLEFVPWDEERIFDVRWAATIAEAALRRLGEECERRGRLRVFTALSKFLSTERVEISYTSLSTSLGVSEATVKRALHRLRVRYRKILREEVARTVTSPADIDDELRYLCAALASEQ
ncbi:MAG: sigma-70 family RNA polymerase sigma factor [Verrucomicrobia bacterium]|nr:MAG: sigma-70 family RNA polymerase sigma factor [Verrucomicrobiota bacterium]